MNKELDRQSYLLGLSDGREIGIKLGTIRGLEMAHELIKKEYKEKMTIKLRHNYPNNWSSYLEGLEFVALLIELKINEESSK